MQKCYQTFETIENEIEECRKSSICFSGAICTDDPMELEYHGIKRDESLSTVYVID